jgi:hypothetical protein
MTMRFLLMGGWSVGARLIPAGAILNHIPADAETGRLEGLEYEGNWLPLPAPVNAQALDQEGYNHLLEHYPYHVIHSAPGIIRHGDPSRLCFRLSDGSIVELDPGSRQLPPLRAECLTQAAYDFLHERFSAFMIRSSPHVIRHEDKPEEYDYAC